jgi:hypothetical protein
VVRVTLDEQGTVLDAKAISGSDTLIPYCLTNVKKWHFQPHAAKTAVIVFNFRMPEGQRKSPGSLFAFQQPNFATVIGC